VAQEFLQAVRAPAYRAAPLVAMLVLEPLAPEQRLFVLLYRGLWIALTVVLTWAATRLVAALTRWAVSTHPVDVSDNLRARRIHTQVTVLARSLNIVVVIIGAAVVLTAFPQARQLGTSLLASAGLAGLVIGFAAKPLFANVIAGIQIALTQPIRIDDVVMLEKDRGRIEEIGSAYVVVKLWDERRLIVPLNYFLEHPFENWTRTSSALLGTATLWLDYAVPLDPLRAELQRLCKASAHWDGRICRLDITDTKENAMEVRALVSANEAESLFDLRSEVREGLIAFVNGHHPEGLARVRPGPGDSTTLPQAPSTS
jgi:small-conductance mechanosensitive channel